MLKMLVELNYLIWNLVSKFNTYKALDINRVNGASWYYLYAFECELELGRERGRKRMGQSK